MKLFDSGFPHFSFGLSNGPPNYAELFGDDTRASIRTTGIRSWQKFRAAAEGDGVYSTFFGLGAKGGTFGMPDGHELIPRIQEYHTWGNTCGVVAKLINRIVHLTGQIEFEEHVFQELYRRWETAWLEEKLFFSIWIPILCSHFDFDRLEIGPDAAIERMSDRFQLARNEQHDFTTTVHGAAIGAATHALVLKDWCVLNKSAEIRDKLLRDIATFSPVLPVVDYFFGAFRVISGKNSGYCQLVVEPRGWETDLNADLPCVYVVTQKTYPEKFDNFGWLAEPLPLKSDEAIRIGTLFQKFRDTQSNALSLGVKRLNFAMLRREEADSVIDVTIALEALLGDAEKNEITHKLAMRMATLCMIEQFPKSTPVEVFRMVKKLYAYRSAIVHGSHSTEKSRMVKIRDDHSIPAVEIGIQLLRHALYVVAFHESTTGVKLDERLLGVPVDTSKVV